MATPSTGTAAAADGRAVLRFERRLPHSPETVWRAITEPDHLRAWFPALTDLRGATGTRLTFEGPSGGFRSAGVILVTDPPRLLEITWDDEVLRFELTADGSGCRLVFSDVVTGDRLADVFSPDAAAGWHVGLDVLASHLDDTAPAWSWHDADTGGAVEPEADWQALRSVYARLLSGGS